jgi:putative ABC transport system permease protein
MMHGWNRHKSSLDDEIREHIDLETQENIEAGMSPEEARHAAMRKFGNVALTQERSREVWRWLWLERLLQDLRYALRGLKNAPGYAVTVVLTLALGLGSVTAMLAIVDSVLLRPVALPRSKQLVMIYGKSPQDGRTYELGYKQMETLRRGAHSLAAVSGYNTMVRPIGAQDGNRMALQTEVTPQFFEMLGVAAKQGRLLNEADEKSPVAVVSAAFWRERMHSDPKAIGSSIRVSGQPRTVIGVLPEGVHVPQGIEGPIVYTPISLNAKGEDELFGDAAIVMARLKPGVSPQQALAETRSVFAHFKTDKGSNQQTVEMASYATYLTGDLKTPLLALTGGVVVLLLIACANAANLQIARATSRMAEMHTRSALGATFMRLLQQLVTESIVVSLLGVLLGGALAYALVAIVRSTYS